MAAAVAAPIVAEVAKELVPIVAEEIRKGIRKSAFAQVPTRIPEVPARLPPIRIIELSEEIRKALAELEEFLRTQGPTFGQDRDVTLLDLLVEEFGSPGIVLAGAAPKAPCRCVTTPTKKLCFRRDVIGTLAQDQLDLCSEFIEMPDGRRRRFTKFREAVDVCKTEIAPIPRGERLEPWLTCMGREARARGIEL